jgi:hypothetical protein
MTYHLIQKPKIIRLKRIKVLKNMESNRVIYSGILCEKKGRRKVIGIIILFVMHTMQIFEMRTFHILLI